MKRKKEEGHSPKSDDVVLSGGLGARAVLTQVSDKVEDFRTCVAQELSESQAAAADITTNKITKMLSWLTTRHWIHKGDLHVSE